LRRVNNALDLRTILKRMIENQVAFKLPDSPHAKRGEFGGLMGCAEAWCFGKLQKSLTGL
jgi:hypothetical protein